MDFDFFLAVNVTVISALTLVLALLRRRAEWSWIAVHAFVAGAGALLLWLQSPYAGLIVTALFVPLIALPGWFSSLASKRAYHGDPKAAARYAKLTALFHPSASQRLGARIAEADTNEDPDIAAAAYRDLIAQSLPHQRPLLEAVAAGKADRWNDVLTIARREPTVAQALASWTLRGLGELGAVDEMVKHYRAIKSELGGGEVRDAQLFVLALAGRRKAVDVLLGSARSPYDAATADYWRAVAAFRSNDKREEGALALQEIAQFSGRGRTRRAAGRHLANPVSTGAALSAEANTELTQIENRLVRDQPIREAQFWSTPLTTVLILINALMFGMELSGGGAEDLETLVNLGAVWPPAIVENGEWWRLYTATLLHFGWVHLAANMFMLSLLGRMVEIAYGWPRMLAIYVIGGVVSSAAALALMSGDPANYTVLVGASGSVMAIFGALAAREVSNWLSTRDVLDQQRVTTFAIVLAVQAMIDLSIPQVSFTAHMAGFSTGFLLGLLFHPRRIQ